MNFVNTYSDLFISSYFKNFKCHGLANVDFKTRSLVARNLSSLIRESRSFDYLHSLDVEKKEIESLKTDGFLVINDFIDNRTISKISENINQFDYFEAHTPAHSNFESHKSDQQTSSTAPIISYLHTDLLKVEQIRKILLDQKIINIVSKYLDCPPTLCHLNLYKTFAYGEESLGVNTMHRDHDDFNFLVAFIYLTDVTSIDDGAFCYVKGSHVKDGRPTEVATPILGKAGTLVIADTWGWHYGAKPTKGNHRTMLWARYGLGLTGAYFQDRIFDYSLSAKDFNFYFNDPNSKFIFRGFSCDYLNADLNDLIESAREKNAKNTKKKKINFIKRIFQKI